jgi:hypothetical protein
MSAQFPYKGRMIDILDWGSDTVRVYIDMKRMSGLYDNETDGHDAARNQIDEAELLGLPVPVPAHVPRPNADKAIATFKGADQQNPPIQDKLFLKNGGLFQGAGASGTPYMNTPEISIIGKEGSTPDAQKHGLVWTYSFALNAPADFIWEELFRKNFSFSGHVAPEFKGASMLLTCGPVNLQSRYDAVKAAMLKTNADYKTARTNLIEWVGREQQAREAEAQRKAEVERKIKKEFDNLKL